MKDFEFLLVSSLEKVFPHQRPQPLHASPSLTCLKNDPLSVQLAYTFHKSLTGVPRDKIHVSVTCETIPDILIRTVDYVPSLLPAYEAYDDNYLTTRPGVFPDLLTPIASDTKLMVIPGQWRCLWIDIIPNQKTLPMTHRIKIHITDEANQTLWTKELCLDVIDALLPEQQLIHTEWFHADCLADYYGVEVFSPTHWEIIDHFIATASRHGMNMLLTPIFTPPLDTAIGGERTTVQLIDVYLENDSYRFDFNKLLQWIHLCQKNGIKYLEIAHLFTQWGAKYTPKIMAYKDDQYVQIFGWDVPATSPSYQNFMDSFLPQLLATLKKEGFTQENTYFHISDEPTSEHLDSYQAAKAVVAHHLEGYPIIDALSSYDFYQKGLIPKPIPANDHIQPFLDNAVANLWVYYCCAQNINVCNRFMSMPSARNRILGVLLYVFDIEGFLHWGYNFYSTQYSVKKINPYCVTDAGEAFPSGDPFLVYPGKDYKPQESIRLMVLSEAMRDLRALRLLESLTSRTYVLELVHKDLDMPITFNQYPKSPTYIEKLRNAINRTIEKKLS